MAIAKLRQIDSATLYQVVEYFSDQRLPDSYGWLMRSTYKATYALLSCQLSVARAPGGFGGPASDPYELLTNALATEISFFAPDVKLEARLRHTALKWCSDNLSSIKSTYSQLAADKENFAPWLYWATHNAWFEHAGRLTGLFNEEHIPFLAKLLGPSDVELKSLHGSSTQERQLRSWIAAPDSDAFVLAQQCYVLSAMMRGVFHDKVANHLGATAVQHPLRHDLSLLLDAPSTKDTFLYSPSEELLFLSAIVLESAAREASQAARIASFASNVKRVREAVARGRVQLFRGDPETPIGRSVVLDRAIEIAKACNLDVTPARARKIIDFVFAFGIDQISNVVFAGSSELAASVASSAENLLPQSVRPSEKFAKLAYSNGIRLRALAEAGVGRLQ